MYPKLWLGSVCVVASLAAAHAVDAKEPGKPIRAGIIGVDTSHAVAFATLLQDPKAPKELARMKIVAAYPVGSPDIPASQEKVGEYTEKLRSMGVEIVGSTKELLKRVDAVLVESVDGRPHLAQARAAILAGKPVFVDKPMAASLADAMQIFRLAKEKHVPCFSSSSLRFSKGFQAVRNGKAGYGPVCGCIAWSPMHTEPHHPDFFWYGIHGVETLFTIMGPGCQTVIRTGPESAVGVWKDGRVGTFLADNGRYGALVKGAKKSGDAGGFDGYAPLVVQIVKFFQTGRPPVSAEETLEIMAFMEAADQSKQQGGAPVSIENVVKKAEEQIAAGKP
jgi:hypothetical protein